jgi:hypothetical protein
MGAGITGSKELQGDLRTAAEEAVDGAKGVVSKGLLNIKQDTKRQWANLAGGAAKHLPKAVTYETEVRGTLVTGEVGPDKDRKQGPLAVFLEFGSVNNAPQPALYPAADREEGRFYEAMEDLGIDLLEGRMTRGEILTYEDRG